MSATVRPADRTREELRRLLRDEGILYASPTQPIRHRDGRLAPWAFYSWQVTLTERGMRLAALGLLHRLRKFHSTQLASYGYTGLPLMNACVLLGGGRYSGLAVREQPKQTVACRQVDGPLDRSRPVVLVDDSLSSGTSLARGIAALRANGFQVEGAVALVYFPGRGGLERARAEGYRVEYLYDITRDLGFSLDDCPGAAPRPATGAWIEDGLHPAEAARRVAEFFLSRHTAPRPPTRFDRPCCGQGGVFVSFRRRSDDYRVARSGFWNFEAAPADPCAGLVEATILTLREAGARITRANLPEFKIAATFLGPLEEIAPRDLDFDRYGIVVRSLVNPRRMGGALPNTQVFTAEIAQYLHARDRNAQLGAGEPHQLFRHTIEKCVEPGAAWLAYGRAEALPNRRAERAVGAGLVRRAAATVRHVLTGRRPSPPPGLRAAGASPGFVAVSLYRGGLLGWGSAGGGSLAENLDAAAAAAAARVRSPGDCRGPKPDVLVTLLHDPEHYGTETTDYVAHKLRAGLDALVAESGPNCRLLLPTALVHHSWSKKQFVGALATGGGLPPSPVRWTGYRTTNWLLAHGRASPVRQGFVARPGGRRSLADPEIRRLAARVGAYIVRHLDRGGVPDYCYDPVADEVQARGTAARAIHALDALGQAGKTLHRPRWQAASRSGLATYLAQVDVRRGGILALADAEAGGLAECVLLAAAAASGSPALADGPAASALATRAASFFRASGAITELPEAVPGQSPDYLPGAALLAIGRFCLARKMDLPDGWQRHVDWCGARFRQFPNWGMAGWLPQAADALLLRAADPAPALLAFEVADWATERQLVKNGAFLEEMSRAEPSFNTGFVAEGIAAAWRIAVRRRERGRARRYEDSWRAACGFMATLVIQPEDTFCLPRPSAALGGVRAVPSQCVVRIDQASHLLHALVDGLRADRP